ncbi:muconolactone Delta-isomerase [Sinosporangium siamense]|uniref:muconolactone Delta-isomerase n=1 Tax=Sinosporangium siamense TaxID=1367973 RepID=A0A919REG9_9ACTN|nr:muconolactone Delta-isomerase family protein [Sinosporangium siamense]GII92123.1 muconolactone Delta-isomerase [Sinosporangium siamense]
MEFLVNIRIQWPADGDPEKYARIAEEERALAGKLAEAGHLIRMWRVPGRRENWGLWRAESPSELHEILSRLPVWPWMDITVHPLGWHPVDPAPEHSRPQVTLPH